MLRQQHWTETIAPGTVLEIKVMDPATTHLVTVQQLHRWLTDRGEP